MSDAAAVLALLEDAGVVAVVGGGWGVDALIGAQCRDHADLDVVIPAAREASAIAALEAAGFVITTDWRPIRVALCHPDGPEVDLHPVTIGPDGTRVQQGFDGVTYEYPAADITTGTIGGREVRCFSAELQMRLHDGYDPTPTDVADCLRLARATGVPPPASVAASAPDAGSP